MADLNSTLVRGNLRVTDEITTSSVTSPKVILNDVQHRLSQEDGTTITRYNGSTIAVPNISGKGAALLTDEGNDFGLLYVGSDGALLANSGDTGYVLRVHDKDTSTDILQVCQTNGTSAFNSNLNVNGALEATSITESGTALSSKYLGINSNAASASIPYGFSSRGTNDWSGVSGTMVTDWSTSSAGDIMFKDDSGKINVITDGYFYQGIDIYGSSKRVLDEYDISHTTWGNAGYASSAGNTPLLLYQDTRDAAVSVSDAVDYNGIKIEFKNKTASSIPSTGTWTALITLDGYSDNSGGYPSQLGFSMSDLGADRHLYMRSPVDGSTWGAWKTIAFHGDNISNFNNDSGYITSSGSCAYATSAGSATDSTKVPLAGNSSSMTGTLKVLGSGSSLGSTSTSITTDTSNAPNIFISPANNGRVYIDNLTIGMPGTTGSAQINCATAPSGSLPKNITYTLPYTDDNDGGTLATQYWVEQKGYSTVSGVNDLTNWTSITINGTTKSIPAPTTVYNHNVVLTDNSGYRLRMLIVNGSSTLFNEFRLVYAYLSQFTSGTYGGPGNVYDSDYEYDGAITYWATGGSGGGRYIRVSYIMPEGYFATKDFTATSVTSVVDTRV